MRKSDREMKYSLWVTCFRIFKSGEKPRLFCGHPSASFGPQGDGVAEEGSEFSP